MAAAKAQGFDLATAAAAAARDLRGKGVGKSGGGRGGEEEGEFELPKGLFEDATLAEDAKGGVRPPNAKVEALAALEAVEARMKEETSMEVKVWVCLQCQDGKEHKTFPVECAAAKHPLESKKRTLYAYACVACSHKIRYGGKMCAVECPKCGKRTWAAASIYNVKAGDNKGLCGGDLKARGEEQQKFLR